MSKTTLTDSSRRPSVIETKFKGWKALKVDSGDLCLHITPQIGGRINGCSYKGRELFYTQPEFEGCVEPRPDSMAKIIETKVRNGFRFYGGYKTWLSPQEEWEEELPYFDLDSGEYESKWKKNSEGLCITLLSPICRESELQLTKQITIPTGTSKVEFIQTMKNKSAHEVNKGLWDVIQILRDGKVRMPLKASSEFPDGFKIFDVENPNREQVRQFIKVEKDVMTVRCDKAVRFKVGTDADEGWITGVFPKGDGKSIIFTQRFQVFHGKVGGHGCTAEVFNSDERPHLEMEVHSPVVNLKPGEEFKWSGEWEFAERTEEI
jgi:hypothetical protein